jgi:proline dehydrogenase
MELQEKVSFDDTRIAFSYKSDKELRMARFIFSVVNHPFISSVATYLVKVAILLKLPVIPLIRSTIFNHFCGGESIEEAESTIHHIGGFGVNTILDYSVEGEKSEEGFDNTTREILKTFDKARHRENIPFCVFKVSGIGDAELFAKVQEDKPLQDNEIVALEKVKYRIDKICAKAYEYDVPVLIDAEESWIQNILDDMVCEMMERYNREGAIVFNTYQLYRTDSLFNLKEALSKAQHGNYFMGAKLVRGAYMEKERERAVKLGYVSPIHPTKEATDKAFNHALLFCIEHKDRIATMCGSHNEHSNHFLTDQMEKAGMIPSDKRVWFAQLYGMSDNISFNLAMEGYNVAKYVPYGPVKSVMPYLLRRAEENTPVAGQSSRELTMIRKEIKRRKDLL